jgi:hypothetical protein
MDIMNMIAQAQNGRGLQALAQKYNLDERQARAAVDELAPAVVAGIRRETQSPDELSGLLGALLGSNHSRYLEGDDDGIVDDGNAILGHVFGSKDVSRAVAAKAASNTGVDTGTLKEMLPAVAAMVMGALGKGVTGGSQARAVGATSEGGIGDMLGQILGGLGGTSSPAAAPDRAQQGSGSGLEGLLGQMLGGGGAATGRPSGGADLENILGSLFGDQAKPEVREEATRKVRDSLGGLLGADSPRVQAADEVLESAGIRKMKKTKLDR